VSEGAFIEAGEPITVVRVDSNRVVVRALNETSPASPS
jgi:membrane-bound ClpP family serine protease